MYKNLLQSLHVPCEIAVADSGHFGGELSHEFHVLSPIGEDKLLRCSKCELVINSEVKGNFDLFITFTQDLLPNSTGKHCEHTFQNLKGIEVAHCFILGERFSKPFNALYQSPEGSKYLYMGCYGLGVTRLLAVCAEYHTRNAFQNKTIDEMEEIRWPCSISPYSVAIITQKESAKDFLKPEESKHILAYIQSEYDKNPLNYAPGDILVDDRVEMSIGRKLIDLQRLGIPWILILKANKSKLFELIDVYKKISYEVSLETACEVFMNPNKFDLNQLPLWRIRQN